MTEKKKKSTKAGGSASSILSKNRQNSRQRSLQRGSRQVQDAHDEPDASITAKRGGGSARREGTKRITVDLPKVEHKFLRDFAYDHDTDGMRVVRALLMELKDNPGLSEKVLRRLPQTR